MKMTDTHPHDLTTRGGAHPKFVQVLALAVLAGSAAACRPGDGGEPTPTTLPPVQAANLALAEGRVVPARHAALSFRVPGTVAKVLVTEGQEVQKGQPLLRLDGAEQAAAVLQAEAGLAAAQAELDRLRAGASAADLAAAQAGVDRAQALAQSAAGAVAQSRAGLGKVQSGPTGIDLAIARRRLEEAKNTLWGVQAARDAICGRADADCDQSDPMARAACKGVREEAKPGCDQAQAQVQATEELVRIAELGMIQLQGGATAADLDAARAGVAQAQGHYNSSQAGLREAEAGLARLRAGASGAELAAAQARVDMAASALEQARLSMDATVLSAPFAGTVAAIEVRENEQVQAGVPAAYLADLSQLEIHTDDLNEINVVGVDTGDRAQITFDAIPDLTLEGRVTSVRQRGESRQGDIVYTVIVNPDRQDTRLRWNMTASVAIDPG